jgi:hypothetical protein
MSAPHRCGACAARNHVARIARLGGPYEADSPARCRSSVVEHSIGNGEVHSSILCGSTIFAGVFEHLAAFFRASFPYLSHQEYCSSSRATCVCSRICHRSIRSLADREAAQRLGSATSRSGWPPSWLGDRQDERRQGRAVVRSDDPVEEPPHGPQLAGDRTERRGRPGGPPRRSRS